MLFLYFDGLSINISPPPQHDVTSSPKKLVFVFEVFLQAVLPVWVDPIHDAVVKRLHQLLHCSVGRFFVLLVVARDARAESHAFTRVAVGFRVRVGVGVAFANVARAGFGGFEFAVAIVTETLGFFRFQFFGATAFGRAKSLLFFIRFYLIFEV